jgi:2-polyprenyl-3-methyl-5-hydroxy-6-metoxy-1,4-benzoquinol methylase
MQNSFNGEYFNEDYFEYGRQTGKSYYEHYRWMPRRSIKEALAICDFLNLDENSFVLDYGCAYGFLVKAFRMLEINADGCDISDYALSFAPEGCWNCANTTSLDFHSSFGYTHIVCKDVLEHLTGEQLQILLLKLSTIA